jgi:two-component system, LuxR family, sensor kinase FixL
MNRPADALRMESLVDCAAPAGGRGGLRKVLAQFVALPKPRALVAASALALAYAVAACVGALLRFPGVPVSALWLPNAILMGALLLTPRRYWWVYLLAVLPAQFLAQPVLVQVPLARALVAYVGNCSTALAGALALSACLPGLKRIRGLRQAVEFTLIAALLVPLATSLVAVAVLVQLLYTGATFWPAVLVRTLTNSFAVLAIVPLMLHGAWWLRQGNRTIPVARAAEACALALVLAALGILIFVAPVSRTDLSAALLYTPFMMLLWAAIRFGVVGACALVTLLGPIATWGALNHTGPFVAHSPVENAVSLLVFLVLSSLSVLLFAVAIDERRRTMTLHAAVLTSIHDQIAVLDHAGVIIEINESWRGFAEDPASAPFERGSVGDRYLQTCAASAAAGNTVAGELFEGVCEVLGGASPQRRIEFTSHTPHGSRWYEISIEALRRAEGGAVITHIDVTARKRAMSQAREQSQQLAHLGRAVVLGELSGAFAHELAQPLTSILGNAEAALQLLPAGTAGLREIREMLRDIIRDDMRAAEVIQRLRAMLACGEIRRQAVDLNQVVRDVLTLARSDLITRNVSVSIQLDPLSAVVLADAVQMQQVVLNLIVNACEAMARLPSAERRLTVMTRCLEQGRLIECSVADRGCGIAATDLERIFQPFVTTKKQGLGLGLAICRSIIEAHGGRLWAESRVDGSGAIFRFTASASA